MRCLLASSIGNALKGTGTEPAGVRPPLQDIPALMLPLQVPCANFLKAHFRGTVVGGVLAVRSLARPVALHLSFSASCRHNVDDGAVEVVCAHSSPSMAYAVHSSAQAAPVAAVARMSPVEPGQTHESRCNVETKAMSVQICS